MEDRSSQLRAPIGWLLPVLRGLRIRRDPELPREQVPTAGRRQELGSAGPGSELLRRLDRPGGERHQEPVQPWLLLPLEPRPPAEPPATPRLPGAGLSNTVAASARSRSRIFPPPPGAVTRESASARRARPAPPPPATARASAAGFLGPRRAGGAASASTGSASPWCPLSPRPCLR